MSGRRAPLARDYDGRFLGYRRMLELFPRIAARDVGRALRDPRRCSYAVTWRFGGSFLCTRDRPGLFPLRGQLRPRRRGVEISLPHGGSISVEVRFCPLPCGGWRAVFMCPWCERRARFLYDVGAPYGRGELRCRRCGGLKYRSEGLFLFRLERKAAQLVGRPIDLQQAPWEARLAAVA